MNTVSRETQERLSAYANLVRKWNPKINLVAPSTLDDLEDRHIADCMQLTAAVVDPKGKWVDIGSGGGFPGIVVAAAFQECDLKIVLIESDQRKSTFLRTAIRELSLARTSVLTDRIEVARPQNADHLSARALAALPELLGYCELHLETEGTAYFMKGRTWPEEVALAKRDWRFSVDAIPSITDQEAAILRISEVSHA
ncbi:16S rRNA (guanine(527)-N(7))-methyltransferase RsmG [Paracoccus zeaxanthinifaciens]|uniref:16S rRNA (guanine(527)-N(7))-methyltransferase RsmG n=1 Tax=Paracoccus zeaxanthinifaciens TaxID=187400 RepID=UPI0003B746B9|nr:16S rRNA (guanine(527)-N(7))-methyltransferase RsmG [Paracoccus zeaxanthinifaciens]